MSIQTFNIETDRQDLQVNPEMKSLYGEIFTPFSLIEKMFSLFPIEVFSNPDKKWLDSGAGTGFFSIFLYQKLIEGLKKRFPLAKQRHNHIIKNMIYMVEIREENIAKLKTVFGKSANIYHQDFLSDFHFPVVDYVIGNPPYNSNGVKKVPTNKLKKKKQDGQTIWFDFIKRAISLLKQNGHLLYIVPSLWMKPDKAGAYNYITQFKLHKICCLTNTETNKYFNKEAQTPTCYFTLENKDADYEVLLHDRQKDEFINHKIQNKGAIPLFAMAVIQKLKKYVEKVGKVDVIKTNMPSKKSLFSQDKPTKNYPFKNIKTCILNKLTPELVINYSNIKQAYADQPKLVLAHKMYGFPYLDELGEFGISNRDNYVIVEEKYRRIKNTSGFLFYKDSVVSF